MRRARRYRGVRQRHWGSWVSEIRHPVSKIRVWLGTFSSAEEAASAYDEAARILCGPKARTNFPTPLSSSPSSPSSSFGPISGQVNNSSALSPSLREKLTRLTVESSSAASPQSCLRDILAFAACIGHSQNEYSQGRNSYNDNIAPSMVTLLPQNAPNASVGLLEGVHENDEEMFHLAPYCTRVRNDVINAETNSTTLIDISILAAAARCCMLLSNAGVESSDPFATTVPMCSQGGNADSAKPVHQHLGALHQSCLVEDLLNEYSWKFNMYAENALSLTKEATTSSDVALPQHHAMAVPPSIMKMNKSLQQPMPAAQSTNSHYSSSSSGQQDMVSELIDDFFQSSACSSFSLDSLPELPFSLSLLRE
ncbi:hypothetical protein GOP47_0018600 [Adiantum capillus-veneris]|uniref:AP2/ERF domain-containing protein n=1 Tax=Adiantum capillus-veneris TaxID=13818 RepID=A0A9D4UDJ9_ADICA|nr:hypothetical protein GOP47_0018600 [Adiantum capillus-veneris]